MLCTEKIENSRIQKKNQNFTFTPSANVLRIMMQFQYYRFYFYNDIYKDIRRDVKIIAEDYYENQKIVVILMNRILYDIFLEKVYLLYLSIKESFFDLDYLNKQEACYEDEYLRQICFKEPLTIIIEGTSNRAAIYKAGFKINNNL